MYISMFGWNKRGIEFYIYIYIYMIKESTLQRGNIHSFYKHLFPIPVGVARRIEKIQRDFLCEGMDGEFEYHLVSWDRVCDPIQCGGLGIRNLVTFNQALLGKWLWRYATEREALWRKIVDLK
jgi:hypothetical protein